MVALPQSPWQMLRADPARRGSLKSVAVVAFRLEHWPRCQGPSAPARSWTLPPGEKTWPERHRGGRHERCALEAGRRCDRCLATPGAAAARRARGVGQLDSGQPGVQQLAPARCRPAAAHRSRGQARVATVTGPTIWEEVIVVVSRVVVMMVIMVVGDGGQRPVGRTADARVQPQSRLDRAARSANGSWHRRPRPLFCVPP